MGQLPTLLWAEPLPLPDSAAAAPVLLPGTMGFAFSGKGSLSLDSRLGSVMEQEETPF